jgi:arylsulfatase
LGVAAFLAVSFGPSPAAEPDTRLERPNVILIVADDLGYGEVGCYGQKKIETPRLDRMAAQGVRFTQYYAGCAVCAPSRCVLLTGRHAGHADVRDNREVRPEGQYPIPADRVTLAERLKARGYATAAVGKWGLGPPGSSGDPLRHGFDLFFGYNCQRHAHNHYPSYLWRNDRRVTLEGNDGGAAGRQYSHDLFEAEALAFIRANAGRPFFLYLPFTVPHLALQVPDDSLALYKGRWDDPPYTGGKGYFPHATPRAAYAAMVSRLDRSVGRVLDLLADLRLDRRTLVLFTSDNGPTHDGAGGSDSVFFESAAGLRGLKGSLFEGGIRVPLVAWGPGTVPAGTVADVPCAAYDLAPTVCEWAGAEPLPGADGLSLLPTLTGRGEQRRHEYLYWEFAGYGGQQAVRLGDWKGIRQQLQKRLTPLQLYHLKDDPGERRDVAGQHPDLVARLTRLMAEAHESSPEFPLAAVDKPDAPRPGPGR